MNRTKKYTSLFSALFAAGALAQVVATEPPTRPNIVFIMADDHNKESTSAYGGRYKEVAPTPGIDRLATEGMLFHRMAATSSLCVPSRAALVTGKYSHINGVRTFRDVFDGSQQTFPKLLQQAGYATALFGKWHLASQPTGFDHYAVVPGQGLFNNPLFIKTGMAWDKEKATVPGYLTDILTDKAIDWLKAHPKDKPFCILVHHKAPHVPHDPAERHKDFLVGVNLPEPGNLLDTYEGRALAEVQDAIVFNRLLINRERQYREMVEKFAGKRDEGTRAIYQAFFKGYLRLVKSLDENVARLLDYLDESGLGDNTIVIYTSDNGFFNGEHGLYNKMWMYEESLMLPLLVRWPGVVKPGAESRELASMLDFAPTFLEIAGAPIPNDIQGVSILPLLRGEEKPLRDAHYYHFHRQFGAPEQFGVRTKTRKLVHYPELGHVRWELFDLEKDPAEMHNLAANPEYAAELERMKELLARKAAEYRDPAAGLLGMTQPHAPIRVLILSGQNNHPWQATTPKLQGILEATGKFKVAVTESPHRLASADFAAADVIVSNWNAFPRKKVPPPVTEWPESVRDAYVAFVRRGGGHVVVHAGSSSFYDWPEYHQICLATWELGTTGHGPPHEFEVRIDDPSHPATAGLEGFRIQDELWHRPKVAEGAVTLASSFSSADQRGSGEWEPSALAGQFGEGRCFTILLGHTAGQDGQYMDNSGFQQLFARGVEWVAPPR